MGAPKSIAGRSAIIWFVVAALAALGIVTIGGESNSKSGDPVDLGNIQLLVAVGAEIEVTTDTGPPETMTFTVRLGQTHPTCHQLRNVTVVRLASGSTPAVPAGDGVTDLDGVVTIGPLPLVSGLYNAEVAARPVPDNCDPETTSNTVSVP